MKYLHKYLHAPFDAGSSLQPSRTGRWFLTCLPKCSFTHLGRRSCFNVSILPKCTARSWHAFVVNRIQEIHDHSFAEPAWGTPTVTGLVTGLFNRFRIWWTRRKPNAALFLCCSAQHRSGLLSCDRLNSPPVSTPETTFATRLSRKDTTVKLCCTPACACPLFLSLSRKLSVSVRVRAAGSLCV